MVWDVASAKTHGAMYLFIESVYSFYVVYPAETEVF